MKKLALSLIMSACALGFSGAASADDTDYISLSAGSYDIVADDDQAADFRLEYRSGKDLWTENLHPWIGLEVTSDTSVWAGFGFLYDWEFTEKWHLVPNVGAGFYDEGDSNKDLDFALEFRSQLELAHEFENQHRLGVHFGHISNASLGDDNPGTEILGAYWHIPVN